MSLLLEDLRATRRDVERMWGQGSWVELDENGRACEVCMAGAICTSQGARNEQDACMMMDRPKGYPRFDAALKAIHDALPAGAEHECGDPDSDGNMDLEYCLSNFSEARGRKRDEVIAVIDKAIVVEEARLASLLKVESPVEVTA